MNLLYFSYWGINEGLTDSTVIPYLEHLSTKSGINKIIFCTVERDSRILNTLSIKKVHHHPIYSKNIRPYLLNKIVDSQLIKKELLRLATQHNIDKVYCKASLAGAFGDYLFKKKKIKYIVDSFEPHADYMLEAGVWKKYGLRYLVQKKWENEQKKNAEFIVTISNNYKAQLIKEGVTENKIKVIPACVNIDKFQLDIVARKKYREELDITNAYVGIYVGKFGDIYYDKEAFIIFKEFFRQFENFHLILLSPHPKEEIETKLLVQGINLDNTYVTLAAHEDVPNFLSASDIAISTIKPTPARKFCSAVKHGEYWANGLSIFVPDGIGDDSEIINNESGGIVFNFENNLVEKISLLKKEAINFNRLNTNISESLAKKYRDFQTGFRIIDKVLNI